MEFLSPKILEKVGLAFGLDDNYMQDLRQRMGYNSPFREQQTNTSSFPPSCHTNYSNYNNYLMACLSAFSLQRLQGMTTISHNNTNYPSLFDLRGSTSDHNRHLNTPENTADLSEYQEDVSILSDDQPSTGETMDFKQESEVETNKKRRRENRSDTEFRQYGDHMSKYIISEMGQKKKNPMGIVDKDFFAEECLNAEKKLREKAKRKSRKKNSTKKEETVSGVPEKSQGPQGSPSLVEFLAEFSTKKRNAIPMILDYLKSAPIHAKVLLKAMQDGLLSSQIKGEKESLLRQYLMESKQIKEDRREARGSPKMIQTYKRNLKALERSLFEFCMEKMQMILELILEPLSSRFNSPLNSLKKEVETFADWIALAPDEIRSSKYRDNRKNSPEVIRKKFLVLLAYSEEMTSFTKKDGTDEQICSKRDPDPDPDQDQSTQNYKNRCLSDSTFQYQPIQNYKNLCLSDFTSQCQPTQNYKNLCPSDSTPQYQPTQNYKNMCPSDSTFQCQPTQNYKNTCLSDSTFQCQPTQDFISPIHSVLSLKVLTEAVQIFLSLFSSTSREEEFESLKNPIISIFQTLTREFEDLYQIPPVHILGPQDSRKKIKMLLIELLSHPE